MKRLGGVFVAIVLVVAMATVVSAYSVDIRVETYTEFIDRTITKCESVAAMCEHSRSPALREDSAQKAAMADYFRRNKLTLIREMVHSGVDHTRECSMKVFLLRPYFDAN